MTKKKLIPLMFILLTVVSVITLCSTKNNRATNNISGEKQEITWEDIFSSPKRIEFLPILTGVTTGDKYLVLDPSDPNIDKIEDRFGEIPILAYWLKHPQEGNFLIDAGLSKMFKNKGNYNDFMSSILSSMHVKTSQANHKSAFESMSQRKEKLNGIFFTHLHADHTSGTADFADDITLFFGKNELDSMATMTSGNHLKGKKIKTLDKTSGFKAEPFDDVIDVFGDRSFFAISTPGHSPDHFSFIINSDINPILITGDAVAYEAQLKYKINPTPLIYNYEKAKESIDKLAQFVDLFPSLKVYYGHDFNKPISDTNLNGTN